LAHAHFSGSQTLVRSYRNQVLKPILKATHGIFFFGAPHDGLHIDDLLHIVETDDEQRKYLIMQLTESSEFLENQKDDLINVWKGFRGRVVSFFETVKTHTVQKVNRSCTAPGLQD
jgi:hypothetical protein